VAQNTSGKRTARELLDAIRRITEVNDINILLERVLREARLFAGADAGTLYLRVGDQLYFSYIENDTLFPEGSTSNAKDKYVYSNNSVEIDRESLAGYVASTGEPLMIDDVYDIQSSVSYSFNPYYDKVTNYKTTSILVVPLVLAGNKTVGVLQLINKKDATGKVASFTADDRIFITYFAQHAASAIKRADLSRQMIMRMVEMAEIRDPHESMQHARRVGDYSLELYDRWAQAHGVPLNERIFKKDIFRTAAILHDVGKVALADRLLHKKDEFSKEDKIEMYRHTIYGARLFRNKESMWDRIAYEVVLNHHERWNGSGYPGHVKDLYKGTITLGKGKQGKEIPLSARIVAVADVFDALISRRSYKEAWNVETALTYIRKQSGKLFDPELVQHFLAIQDVLQAIIDKHSESPRR
jgi:HD-GYP domain-containing protein (c-di-GMP phosphodiesterase class II)